ncbi:hypothetical protein ACA910_022108 [Epithemia clementina (nom. ined.)]
MLWNKLTSPKALATMDLNRLPTCHDNKFTLGGNNANSNYQKESSSFSRWQRAIHSWHGDFYQQNPLYQVNMLQDLYCQPLCWMDFGGGDGNERGEEEEDGTSSSLLIWQYNIDRDMHFNVEIDGMPVAYKGQDEFRVDTRYWGGIPLGRRQSTQLSYYGDHDDGGGVGEAGANSTSTSDNNSTVINNNDNNNNKKDSSGENDDIGSEPAEESYDYIIYNHWNIELWYHPTSLTTYQVVRAIIEPLSIRYDFDVTNATYYASETTGDMVEQVTFLDPVLESCMVGSTTHTSYLNTYDWDFQWIYSDDDNDMMEPPLNNTNRTTTEGNGQRRQNRVLFTYDVIWKPVAESAEHRWDIFLTMDNAVPLSFQLAGVILGLALNVAIYGSLIVWIFRDLSYKPIYYDTNDFMVMDNVSARHEYDAKERDSRKKAEAARAEMNLWPLSSQLFLPPRNVPWLLCAFCGTGVQLMLAGLLFVIFFRLGIINQSIGASILTPAVVLYTITSPIAGVVTGRLSIIFHAPLTRAMWTTAFTATAYPILGILVIHFVYDVFPYNLASNYSALSNGTPIIMIWLWVIVPLTLVGGYVGHWLGPLADFPMASSAQGYQELHLQVNDTDTAAELDFADENDSNTVGNVDTFLSCCWSHKSWNGKWRTVAIFLLAGIPPVLSCFVAFSYGIAGPVFVGYFSSSELISIAPFVLFVTCAAGVSALLYYRQIRSYSYAWWWPAFISGGSCGLYIFLLALSWLFFTISKGNVQARTFAAFFFWFAFLSIGTAFICGAAGIGACILLSQFLYVYTTLDETDGVSSIFGRRGDEDDVGNDGASSGVAGNFVDGSQKSMNVNAKLACVPEETEEDVFSRSTCSDFSSDERQSTDIQCEDGNQNRHEQLSIRMPPHHHRHTAISNLYVYSEEEKSYKDGDGLYDSENKVVVNEALHLIPRRLPLTARSQPQGHKGGQRVENGRSHQDSCDPVVGSVSNASYESNRGCPLDDQSVETGSGFLVFDDDEDHEETEIQSNGVFNVSKECHEGKITTSSRTSSSIRQAALAPVVPKRDPLPPTSQSTIKRHDLITGRSGSQSNLDPYNSTPLEDEELFLPPRLPPTPKGFDDSSGPSHYVPRNQSFNCYDSSEISNSNSEPDEMEASHAEWVHSWLASARRSSESRENNRWMLTGRPSTDVSLHENYLPRRRDDQGGLEERVLSSASSF